MNKVYYFLPYCVISNTAGGGGRHCEHLGPSPKGGDFQFLNFLEVISCIYELGRPAGHRQILNPF